MSSEELKDAWQAQPPDRQLSVDLEQLLAEVRRNQLQFRATIFWRDIREVGTALVMIPVWLVMGITMKLPWSWYLVIPALVWVAVFMLVDRRRHRRPPAAAEAPLREYLESCLADVEHQIWLLRNVFWWYLLPIALGVLAFVAEVAWRTRQGGWSALLAAALVTMTCLGVFAAIHWMNQFAVRTFLEPRRQELLALRTSLEEETGRTEESAGAP